MKLLRALSTFALSLAILISAGCQSASTTSGDAAAGAKVLRVGVTSSLAPMAFKQGGELVGLEVEAARELGQQLGRPVQFVEVKWEDQIPALLAGRTDIIMSSMTITPERRMRVAFSNPYLRVGQMMLIKRSDGSQYSLGVPPVLPGTVGVLKGTVGEFYVQREFSSSDRRAFGTAADAASALLAGRINSFISDASIIWYQAALHESDGLGVVPRQLTNETLGWAVRPNDAELLKQANDFIAARQANGSLNAMIKRWLPLAN